MTFPIDVVLTSKDIETHRIGFGDDVHFLGLFQQYAGRTRNEPVVRWGNIAAMPQDPVRAIMGPNIETEIEGIFVEARSWGGHSGSPVFVEYPQLPHKTFLGKPTGLLGLVQGHYTIKGREIAVGDIAPDQGEIEMNAGMALIVPAQKIRDLLEREDLVKEREELLDQYRKTTEGASTPDANEKDEKPR